MRSASAQLTEEAMWAREWEGFPRLGELLGGKKFAGIDEFKQLLLQDKDQIARALAGKVLVYGTGHQLGLADHQEIENIVAAVRKQNYGFRTLVHQVIQSDLFRSK